MKRYAKKEIIIINTTDKINRKRTIDDTISFLECFDRVTSLAPITSRPKIEIITKKDIKAKAKLIWPNP